MAVTGQQKISQRISKIREATGAFLFGNELKELLLRRTRDRFDRQVDPDGVPWTPLSLATLRRRARAGVKGRRILYQTGALREAIVLIQGSGFITATNTGAGFRIGVQDPAVAYGRIHQNGIGVPRRQFLGIGKLDVVAVSALLRRRIIPSVKG